jgi:recombination protein RecA
MRLGEATQVRVDVIPSGSFGLDVISGVGGYPRGRVIEIYGPEASGKTTLALHAIAETHKMGGKAAFIDAEHALDPTYAKALGVNVDDLIISQPDYGEQALEIVEMLVRSNAIDLIVVDSVAALVPKAEIEGEMGDAQVGLQARLMSKAMRKLIAVLNRSKTCAIFINQIRQQIQTGFGFGNPETTPGGLALKFHASMRIEIRKIASIKQGEDVIGNRVKVRVVKNKLSPPFKSAEFDIIYGEGISYEGELIDWGLEHGIIKRSGTWFSYKDIQLGQGREKARIYLKENPEIEKEIERELKRALGLIVE